MNTHDPIHHDDDDGRRPHDASTRGDAAFDRRLRAIHAQAVDATPARVRLQLRPRPARPDHHAPLRWSMAAAFAIGLVAVGLLWQRPSPRPAPAPASTPVIATTPAEPTQAGQDPIELEDAYAALDESPDLYLWLASSDANAMLGSDTLGISPATAEQ